MFDGPRQHRAGDGGIHRQQRAGRMRDLRGGGDVGDAPQRVGGRLHPDQLGLAGLDGSLHGGRVRHVDEFDPQAPVRGEVHQPVAQRPVHHLRRQHMVARRQRLEHRRGRGHAAGEQRGLGALLQRAISCFGLVEGRVVGARIDAARAVLVVRVAQVGGRDVDRRRDRTRRLVDPAQRLGGEGFGFERLVSHRRTCSRPWHRGVGHEQTPRNRLGRAAGVAPWGERRRRFGGVNTPTPWPRARRASSAWPRCAHARCRSRRSTAPASGWTGSFSRGRARAAAP